MKVQTLPIDMIIELHNCDYTIFEIVAATKVGLDDVIKVLAKYRQESGYYDKPRTRPLIPD